MTEPLHDQNPDPTELADDDDTLNWDRAKHGRMADHATDPEDEPQTVPWED